jgi:hypothetical protein
MILEQKINALMQVWKDILGFENVNPNDDFFAMGGTSMMAIRMEAGLFEQGWYLSAADIFQNPELGKMVELMVPAEEIDWEELD